MNFSKMSREQYQSGGIALRYYEIKNERPVLIMLHAQGTDALSFQNTFRPLSKHFHIISIDCPGHGLSDKDKTHYNIVSIGNAILDFIKAVVIQPAFVVGHSSGGLLAAYVAANTEQCAGLILEDPPFFSCQGDRRYKTYNYLDLSTICHNFIETKSQEDFVLYYFEHQKMWEFFPDDSRDKIKAKLLECARRYRTKHPQKPLKVPFFPRSALAAYRGMNEYDPHFGEAFYSDTFHAGIAHEDILKRITCNTLLMKAKTNYSDDGVLLAAMSEEDAASVERLIPKCQTVHFDCGHGVHIEKEKEFLRVLLDYAR